MTRPLLLSLSLPIVLGSCTSLASHVHNLHELHGSDGSVRYVGDLTNALELAMRDQSGGIRVTFLEDQDEITPEAIDNPYGECLSTLLELAEYNSADPRIGGVQVELFAWLAVDDAYALSRERCLLELADHAERLEIGGLAPEPADAAGPEALQAALMVLQENAFFTLRAVGARDTPAAGLRDACSAVAALSLSRAGARRALAFTNILMGAHGHATGADRLVAAPLFDLHRELQGRLVALTLHRALDDPHALVRAAALEAALRFAAADAEQLLERALSDPDQQVLVRALEAIERAGLPGGPEVREVWLERLVTFTQTLDGRVSAAACRALGATSGSGITSLRAEDWRDWWRARPNPAAGPGTGPAPVPTP